MPELLIGGRNGQCVRMNAALGNRHGIITGATGTGKTISLQILAEGFSRIGVPVFMTDIKGDLSGIAGAGQMSAGIRTQLQNIGLEPFVFQTNSTVFWDVFGQNGHPLRTTISDMGPLLLSHVLQLNETQTGVLYSAFRIADDNGLLLLDLKDLRALLSWMSVSGKPLRREYGGFSSASVGAIQRRLLILQEQGAEHFFAEPALELGDLLKTDFSGNGVIGLLDATVLSRRSPHLYAALLLWLLSDLFETLPEVGDADRPRLVLFFDEAHYLFNKTPQALVDKIEQIVRLIRSKGVGVFFISQNPMDIPETILGQCGLKIQHGLRAYTPKDKKNIKAIAQTFRSNPAIDTETAITRLQTGEALVSVLNADGSPAPVERIFIRPPQSKIGPIDDPSRHELLSRSPFQGRYESIIDRESAYERLQQRAEQKTGATGPQSHTRTSRNRESIAEALLKSVARSMGRQIGRQLVRGILGSLLGRR